MKKLLIINTGGTFSSVESERGLKPGLSSRELLEAMRLVAGGIELEMEDLFLVDSANIFPDDWRRLAERIYEAAAGYQGIVVIHGTDTMAYTASMLSFMLQNVPIPVVLTGSQLSISHPVADAMENCRCAVHMAAGGHGGVFLAFNRKVMLGVRASKVRTMSFDAFESINYPDVAQISSLGLRIHTGYLPEIKGGFRLCTEYSDRVFVLKMYPGIRPELLSMLEEHGYRGVYIEAFGLGGLPFLKNDFLAVVERSVKRGMTVLVGSQCRYEGSSLSVYETGLRALNSGVLQAYDMTAEAAVTKLMWVLGQTDDRHKIEEYFSENLVQEVRIPV